MTEENVGSLAPVSNIEATPATRLFELWLEQSLLDKKMSIRAGQLAADSGFLPKNREINHVSMLVTIQ